MRRHKDKRMNLREKESPQRVTIRTGCLGTLLCICQCVPPCDVTAFSGQSERFTDREGRREGERDRER